MFAILLNVNYVDLAVKLFKEKVLNTNEKNLP